MEKANLNPKYTGVHIWLRKDGNLKKAFEDKVGYDIYNFFKDIDAYGLVAEYGEHNFMWLSWRGLEGLSTGSYGGISQANTQIAKDIANQLPTNKNATYGGTFWTGNQSNTSWFYGKRLWISSQIWYLFGWTWWNSHHHPNGVNVGYTKFSQHEPAVRYFEGVSTDISHNGQSFFGLGPGAFALWLTNGKPSTDLFELFSPYFNAETKNYTITKIHPKWRGYFLKPRYKIIKFCLTADYTTRQAIGNANSIEILNFKYDLRAYSNAANFTSLEKLAVGGLAQIQIEFKHSYEYKEAGWEDSKPWPTVIQWFPWLNVKVVETIDVPFCSPDQSDYMIKPRIEDVYVGKQLYKDFTILSSQIFTYAATIWEPIV